MLQSIYESLKALIIQFFGPVNLESFSEFLKEASIQALGAFIAIWGAFWLFKKQIKAEEKVRNDQEKDLQYDKLKYLYVTARKIFNIASAHHKSFEKISTDYNSKPFELHLLSSTPIYEFKRFTEYLKIEEYFLAYTKLVGGDKDSVKKFIELINNCEFVCFNIEDGIRFHEERTEVIYKLKMEFKNHWNNVESRIINALLHVSLENDNNFKEKWENCLGRLRNNNNNGNPLLAIYNSIIVPMSILFETNKTYRFNPALNGVYESFISCHKIYSHIDSYGPNTAKTLNSYKKAMDKGCYSILSNLNPLDEKLREIGFDFQPLPTWPNPKLNNASDENKHESGKVN